MKKLPISFQVILCFSIFFHLGKQVYGQSYKEYVPPTPTAAALGKYVDQPVSLYTGTPDINIPIYEIKCGTLSLPISLSYHAGGFRVEEDASWVGLGWSLLAGGAVTRTILDKQDTGPRDSFFNTYSGNSLDPTIDTGFNALKLLSHGTFDGYPDIFNFNFNGKNGRFFEINGEIHLMPEQPLEINRSETSISIIDENGNTYVFRDVEKSSTKSGNSSSLINTSWYLTQITSPSQDTINFEYKPTEFYQNVSLSQTKTYKRNAVGFLEYQGQTDNKYLAKVYGKELSEIKFSQGKVIFLSDYDREDLAKPEAAVGGLRLSGVEVYDKQGQLIKKIGLTHNYFDGQANNSGYVDKRLKLLTVDDYKNPVATWQGDIASHSFTYEENEQLPQKTSFSQDHWGYYNKKLNISLIPELSNQVNCNTGAVLFKPNREPDTLGVKADVLIRIDYPTGGFTKYDYEPHDYSLIGNQDIPIAKKPINGQTYSVSVSAYEQESITSSIFIVTNYQCLKIAFNMSYPWSGKHAPFIDLMESETGIGGNLIQHFTILDNGEQYIAFAPGSYYFKASAPASQSIAAAVLNYQNFDEELIQKNYAGGIRIKKITQHSGIGPDIVKTYKYEVSGSAIRKSSGTLLAEPNYVSDDTYSYHLPTANGNGISGPASLPCTYIEEQFANFTSYSTVILGSGNHIGYREVTVYSGINNDQGKSVHKFYAPPNINNSGEYNQNWRQGVPIETKEYNQSGKLLQKVAYSYSLFDYHQFYAIRAINTGSHPCAPTTFDVGAIYVYPSHFSQTSAALLEEFRKLSKTISTKYFGSDSISTSTEYFYDNVAHLQPSRVISSTSNSNEVKVTATTYPDDYADTNGFIADLKASHIIVPIEQVEYKQDGAGNNQKILNGTVTTYKPGNINKGLKDQVWQLELNAPVSLSNFKFSSRVLGALPHTTVKDYFQKDSRYKQVLTYNSYDQQNRPNQLTKAYDQPVAMLWSKDGENLLAQVINARADQIFYTSFEEDGTVVSQTKTGEKTHTGGFTIPGGKEPISGTYVLSFWERQNGQWKYQEQQINYQPGSGPIIITPNEIDEVRLYPPGATMTTYTYKPLVGNTSVCDQNNQVTYYFYDSAGRLSQIKDDNGNILQKYEYKYVNQ